MNAQELIKLGFFIQKYEKVEEYNELFKPRHQDYLLMNLYGLMFEIKKQVENMTHELLIGKEFQLYFDVEGHERNIYKPKHQIILKWEYEPECKVYTNGISRGVHMMFYSPDMQKGTNKSYLRLEKLTDITSIIMTLKSKMFSLYEEVLIHEKNKDNK